MSPLFRRIAERQALDLVSAEPAASGRLHVTYRLATGAKGGRATADRLRADIAS
jgi:hypothetical protein